MTSEIEEAVAEAEAFVAIDFRHSFRTILSALTASQAEVEGLGRERDEAREVCSAHLDLEQHWNREYHKAQQRAQAAEARATRAEGLLEEAGEVLNRLLAWANRRCPCYNDSPSPCPLCGARVDATDENGVCKAAEYTVPGDLLQAARAFLDKLKEQGQ